MLLVCSCSTTYKVERKYASDSEFIGRTHSELVDMFGAPSAETPDGNGGHILSFENCDRFFSYIPNYVKEAGAAPTVQFYMNEDGSCYRVFTLNTTSVRAHSPGKTVALVVSIIVVILLA